MKTSYYKTRRATYNLTVHLVLVTKYRRQVLTSEMLSNLEASFKSVLEKWDAKLIEFNGEADHIHVLISYPPHKLLSGLISNLKSTSCKNLWKDYQQELAKTYWGGKKLWTGAYFVASCGGVTIEQLKKYVQNQDSPQ
ncbi:transposase IS200-family protein [Stanieria cyanosphaera PCC 7437]|uniref:Transposase IS200-family protein n=1 Tax=Stanieria cyanosphaera (strain ATCC 29371 / PCC 7437) TaxID=111780 RepID=K9XZC1_STAC7|nr:IS200/IS605 family transposase [Stanieria cyanosphaera]AFZ37945.1 transposase IS200-family protein [Stanieria cyanosphaera PCC 7437]